MFRVVLRSMTAHKRRLIGTCSAVVLGVAFLAGTLVLGDSMRAAFGSAFATANAGISAVVQGKTALGTDAGTQRSPVPESLVPQISQLSDVQAAVPTIEAYGQLLGSDGVPIGGQGPPTFAQSWITNPDLTTARITQGRAPSADGEVVINEGAATTGKLAVGDSTSILVPRKVPVTIVGIASFGVLDTAAGPTFTAFTFEQAQQLFAAPGEASTILVQAKSGVEETAVVEQIQPLLPTGVEAITEAQLTADQEAAIQSDFLGFFQTFLLIFAMIALVVGTFSIYNTFSVIVAQRSRESALLRAIGASRGQVLRSVTLESLLIGVLASVIGVGVGIGFASGLMALMSAVGFGLPSTGLVIAAGTIGWSLLVGVAVTLIASIAPAVRASRVAPLAALRELNTDASGTSMFRKGGGAIALVLGISLLISPLFWSGSSVLMRTGLGALLTFLGFVIAGPVAAGPVGRLIGAPVAWTRGAPGKMAKQNAVRNPKRTANTAAALMIGVCIVSLITVFGASIKSSIEQGIAGGIKAQLIYSQTAISGAGYSPDMTVQIDRLPEVAQAAGLGNGPVLVNGSETWVAVADVKALPQVLEITDEAGSLTQLAPGQVAVEASEATTQGWQLGSKIPLVVASGQALPVTVGAIIADNDLLQPIVVPRETWDSVVSNSSNTMVLVELAPGVSIDAGKAALAPVSAEFGAGAPQDIPEFVAESASQIDQLLNIVYVLLVLAIIIALMGISNTLSLAVHERTRELGLLRAVGQTRAQTRSMVRWESMIIAVFGTVGGLGLGALLGWALMSAIAAEESFAVFSLPVPQLLVIAVVGALAGVIAGIRPAARAAKLNVLDAIATS